MAKLLHYARLLTTGAKNPIPKKKRKVIKQAEKDIDKLEKLETPRSKSIEESSGVASDITKAKRDRAKRARRQLMAMK